MAREIRSIVWAIGVAGFALGHMVGSRSAYADELRIVASIKPIHSLVAGVTAGVTEPTLLIKGSGSPHDHSLKPSDAAALEAADVVFWVGESFETFLAQPLGALAGGATIVTLAQSDGVMLYERREGGLWDDPDHDHMVASGDDEYDGHLWLDTRNAEAIVGRIADTLSELDPADAAAFQANARRMQARLLALDVDIEQALGPVRGAPFIVFHDAFQYFERRYRLAGVGSITSVPEQTPGAKRLRQIQDAIIERRAVCVFREPNFEPILLNAIAAGTSANIGVLDPEGASIREGPDLYFELMRGIARSLNACLSTNS
ncbi:MAG: zinc ABC transporter substrate-binding protein [Dongiaceae bacterium]